MNTNIILFTILDMSKVFLWPHNHLLHWSHIITTICKYIINITCDTYKEWDEISYAHVHEWMDDAWAHEMQVTNAMLNTRVLHPPISMLLWGAAYCVKYIIVMQMIVHAWKSWLWHHGTAVERHCQARGVALPHLLQQHRSSQAPRSRLYINKRAS